MLNPSLLVDAGVFSRMVRFAGERNHIIFYELSSLVMKVGIEAVDQMQESLIDFYGSGGHLVLCHYVLQAKLATSIWVWNIMLTMHLDEDEIYGANVVFRALMMMGFPNPNEKALVNLMLSIPLYAPDTLLGTHAYIQKTGSLFAEVINALLLSYSDFGYLKDAIRVIDEFGEAPSNINFWNCAIDVYATHGLADEAVKTFRAMVESGWIPNEITLVTLMEAFGHTGRIEETVDIYQNMLKRHGVPQSWKHFFALVDAICRAGKFDKALLLISSVKSNNRDALWRKVGVWGVIYDDFEAGIRGLDNISKWNVGDFKTMAHLFFKMEKYFDSEIARKKYHKSEGYKYVGVSMSMSMERE